jgi:hypothetical protein
VYATEQQLVQLLSPESAKVPDRAQDSREALAANVGRMGRLKQLIADEQKKIDDQIAKGPPPGQGSAAPDPKQVEAQNQQLEQQKQMLNGAEALRASAEKSLAEIETAIKANKDPLTPAKKAEGELLDLRKLFFSVTEHLQELLKDQNETKDQTSQANTEDDFTRAPKLPGLAKRETDHGEMAKAITEALAKQADAGQKKQQQPGGDDAKKFADAAAEVRLATTDMGDAKNGLDKAATAKQSVSLDPPVKSETKAIEHLEKALQILQPPQKNDQKNKDDQKQDQQKQQDDKKKQDQQQQQGGAGQRARDEDAKRQKEKQQQGQDQPVDQDW